MVVASLALFISLGGTGYALTALPKNSVGTKQLRKAAVTAPKIKNGTVRAADIRRNTILGRNVHEGTLGSREIAEAKLTTVPSAATADRLQGLTPFDLKLHCPADTVRLGDGCMETPVRGAQSPGQASGTCVVAGRRLALFGELTSFYSDQHPIDSHGELTAILTSSPTVPNRLDAVVVLNNTGTSYTFVDANGADAFPFRCVAPLTN